MMLLLYRLYQRLRQRRSSAPATRAPTPARAKAPAAGRTVRALGLVAHQARFELLGFVRNRQARFFTVALPVIFLVVFVGVFGNDTAGPENVKATTQRELGILKRRRATPVPAWVLIAGRTLSAMVVGLAVMTVLLAIGRFAYGVHLPGSTIPGVLLTAVVGSVAFCCLGYALCTAISSADSAQPLLQAVMLPLYFISGVFIPSVGLPDWLQQVARVFPVQHLADGLHHALDPAASGSGIVWSDLGILALWAAVGLTVALRRFTWTPAAAAAAA